MAPSTTQTVLTAVAAIVVGKMVWTRIPSWLKVGKKKSSQDVNDDLTNPLTILGKVNDVLVTARNLRHDVIPDDMPFYTLQYSFMSIMHLMKEINHNHPNWRESFFSKEGREVQEFELENLVKYFDFADKAYEPSSLEVISWLKPLGYKLIRHDNGKEPGRIGHFMAVHHGQKQIVLAIKGTSDLSNVLTSTIGKPVAHSIRDGEKIQCHEGMYVAAKTVLDDTLHLLQNFFIPQKYKLIVCGHSLGAGVSSLIGIFLKQQLPGLDMHIYGYGTPPCCSSESSLASQSYITSVINNNDFVPRVTLTNLRTMYKLFMFIDKKLKEEDLSPDSLQAAKNYLADLMAIDTDTLLTPGELTGFFNKEFDAIKNESLDGIELHVPGRIVSIWNHTKDPSIIGGKVTDGASQVLQKFFVDKNILSDHKRDNYRQNLSTLLEQAANTI